MTTLDDLRVNLSLDARNFNNGLRQANATAQSSTRQMTGAFAGLKGQLTGLIPAVTITALVAFGKRAVDAAGHIQDLADRTGFAASTLSALEAPLKASGSSLDDFTASMAILSNQLGEAAKGNQEAVKAFDQLGLSVRKLEAMTPEERFYAVTQALAQLEDQAKMTEAGRNLLGRGFAAMIPLIKETNGNLEEHIARQKELKETLSDETIKRIDEFGDALSNAGIKARNAFLEAFVAIMDVVEAVDKALSQVSQGNAAGGFAANKIGVLPEDAAMQNYLAKARAAGFVTEASVLGAEAFGPGEAHGPSARKGTALDRAKGSNAGLLKEDKKKQAKDIDELNDQLEEYLTNLENENLLLGLTGKAQAAKRAELEANALAIKQDSLLTDEQKEKIRGLAAANYELQESMQESMRFSRELKDRLSAGLAEVAIKFDSATDAARRFAEQLAQTIIERKLTGPIGDALLGTDGESGLLDGVFSGIGNFLGFAGGGRPPVGKPSIVGERGPELFVPDSAGTVVPNHAMGGKQVIVHQTIQIYPGVEETVEMKIRQAAPFIAAQAQAGVFAAIERGGRESRLVNRRG